MSFSFGGYSLTLPFSLDLTIPKIYICSAPDDRYTKLLNIPSAVCISMTAPTVSALTPLHDGFIVERSDDFGQTWADISGVVRDSFFHIDRPPAVQDYHYRAKTRGVTGLFSLYGNVVIVANGTWGNADRLGVHEIQTKDGVVADTIDYLQVFPNGFDGSPHTGMSISEGSAAGNFGSGYWYIKSQEYSPPVVANQSPACGSTGVLVSTTNITYTLQDLPYPAGGSGIDDSSIRITLAVVSQQGGSALLIRDGVLEPWSPTITCAVTNGVDPVLDRDVSITVPAGYLKSADVVTIVTVVKDLDGNKTTHTCTFTMETIDQTIPTVTNQKPKCGTGLTASDTSRAKRDTAYTFKISDVDSGVDQTTIQVYHGTAVGGPWTQVLQNGATFLNNFTGLVIADGSGGFDVTIFRPTTSPLWPADGLVYFRVLGDDLAGNSVEDICGFRVVDCVRVKKALCLAENLLYVEFTAPVENSGALRVPENYIVEPVQDNAIDIRVTGVVPQRFPEPTDPENPVSRLGDGLPTFVILETSPHIGWGVYRVRTQNLRDEYGNTFCTFVDPDHWIQYRAKFSKVDIVRQNMLDIEALGTDTNLRQIITAISHQDERIGGVFLQDDWEKL